MFSSTSRPDVESDWSTSGCYVETYVFLGVPVRRSGSTSLHLKVPIAHRKYKTIYHNNDRKYKTIYHNNDTETSKIKIQNPFNINTGSLNINIGP